ncbi:hypothetical protein U1Q18_032989 [Sarracenia purpurea var. burkii]
MKIGIDVIREQLRLLGTERFEKEDRGYDSENVKISPFQELRPKRSRHSRFPRTTACDAPRVAVIVSLSCFLLSVV